MAILQKTDVPMHVVLSEIDIPGSMNGFKFAVWARSLRPELKIVLAATRERTVQNAAELYNAARAAIEAHRARYSKRQSPRTTLSPPVRISRWAVTRNSG
jgi:hypothetical protein